MDVLVSKAIIDYQNKFSAPENTHELIARVKEVMPLEESEYKLVNVQGNTSKFKACVKVNFKDHEEGIRNFIENYGIKNNETLRISKTKKGKDGKVDRKYFRCHHNTRHEGTKWPDQILASKPSKRFKNTNCPFSLIFKIDKNPDEMDFSSIIDMEWNHNHSVESLHSLSFKDIPASVVCHIKEMFASGLLPSAAYRELLRQIRSECKDDLEYHQRISDRSQAPRRKDFNDIYTEYKKECYGTGSLSDMFASLEERIKDLKIKDEEFTVEFQKFDEEIDQPFILVVITPLMKRVHKMVSICCKFYRGN